MTEDALVVLVIDPDVASRNYLAAMLRQHQYTVIVAASGREGLVSAWKELPAAVIFEPALPDISSVELVTRLRQERRTEDAFLVALASKEDPDEISQLMVARCNEYLVKSPVVLERLLEIMPRPSQDEDKPKAEGHLIVLLSAKGGTGTSSLCANIATSVARQNPDASVVVVDMVLPIGSIANIVGMGTDTNQVTVAEEYTRRSSSSFFMTHLPKSEAWGFWVLPGSPDPETASHITVERINEMLLSMLLEFDYVFVDLGRALSRISLPIIRRADSTVLIVSTDLSAVTLTRTVLDYLKAQGIAMENIYTILNRPVGIEGMLKPDVEEELGMPVHLTIPYVAGNFTMANNNHVPLSLRFPNDSAVLAVQQAASEIYRSIQKA